MNNKYWAENIEISLKSYSRSNKSGQEQKNKAIFSEISEIEDTRSDQGINIYNIKKKIKDDNINLKENIKKTKYDKYADFLKGNILEYEVSNYLRRKIITSSYNMELPNVAFSFIKSISILFI